MNRVTIAAITRRELEETGTDWRMMIPLLVLSLVVPLCTVVIVLVLLHAADQRQVASLVPFALLLSGFLPSGFSLVNASESFVGERERSTLESLLATPMTDRELYTGKLLAVLAIPVLGSFIAMLLFLILFWTQAPSEALALLPASLIGLIAVLVVGKALVMVSAALVISIHATTVRAANLLASFLLLPMALIVQVEALLLSAREERLLFAILLVLGLVSSLMIRTGFAGFNRERVLARDHRGLHLRRGFATFKRMVRAYSPPGALPAPDAPFSLRAFYRRDVPRLFHDYRRMFAVTGCIAVASIILGAFVAQFGLTFFAFDVSAPLSRSDAGVGRPMTLLGDGLRQSLLPNLLGAVSFGLFSVAGLVSAAAQLGYELAWFARYPDAGSLPQTVLHTLLWLPPTLVAFTVGMRLGIAPLLTPRGVSPGLHVLWSLANFLKVYMGIVLPWSVLAAWVEGWLLSAVF